MEGGGEEGEDGRVLSLSFSLFLVLSLFSSAMCCLIVGQDL